MVQFFQLVNIQKKVRKEIVTTEIFKTANGKLNADRQNYK